MLAIPHRGLLWKYQSGDREDASNGKDAVRMLRAEFFAPMVSGLRGQRAGQGGKKTFMSPSTWSHCCLVEVMVTHGFGECWMLRGGGSVGKALALHAQGWEFEPQNSWGKQSTLCSVTLLLGEETEMDASVRPAGQLAHSVQFARGQ